MTEAKDMENAKAAAPAAERRRIGPYELVRLLGRGGMSEVYEAENPRLGTRHALKLYAYEKDDPEVRERFLVEGRLLARLNHPRIVKVTDFGTDGEGGQPYFVMDLVLNGRGEMQLLSDVQPGTVDEEMVGRWYDDLREGLAVDASDASLRQLFRDLACTFPGNVLLEDEAHRFRFLRNDDHLISPPFVSQHLLVGVDFAFLVLLLHCPLDILGQARAFFLGEGREDGKHHLAIAGEGVDMLFLEPNLNTQLLQPANR